MMHYIIYSNINVEKKMITTKNQRTIGPVNAHLISVHYRPHHCVIGAIFSFGARKSANPQALSAQEKNLWDATSRSFVRRPDL